MSGRQQKIEEASAGRYCDSAADCDIEFAERATYCSPREAYPYAIAETDEALLEYAIWAYEDLSDEIRRTNSTTTTGLCVRTQAPTVDCVANTCVADYN